MLETAELQKLKSLAAQMAEHAFSSVQFYIVKTKEAVISVRERGHVTRRAAEDTMYSIEACYQGKRSRIYTNQLEDCASVIETMKMTSEVYEEYQEHIWVEPEAVENGREFCWDSNKESIPALLSAEEEAYKTNAIRLVHQCCYKQKHEKIFFIDENMKIMSDSNGYHSFRFGVIAQKGNDTESINRCIYGSGIKQMNVGRWANKVVAEAVQALGGAPLISGNYNVIFSGTVMAELLEAYIPAFYADNMGNQMSGLSNQRGKQIASSHLYLKEMPHNTKGRCIRNMDDEGTPVAEKYLIRNGIMEQALYNRSTAQKEKVQCTGNGFRSSIQSDIEIGVTNIIFGTEDAAKWNTQKEMEALMKEGLLVTKVDGVLAGTNIRTGTFSLLAEGHVVRNSVIQEAFCQVTIAGNFFQLLKNINCLGKDTDCIWLEAMCVLTPAVMAGEITISGK